MGTLYGIGEEKYRSYFFRFCRFILWKYYSEHKCSFDVNELIKKYDSFIVVQVMNYCCCEKKDNIYYINFESVNKLEQYVFYFTDFAYHY